MTIKEAIDSVPKKQRDGMCLSRQGSVRIFFLVGRASPRLLVNNKAESAMLYEDDLSADDWYVVTD